MARFHCIAYFGTYVLCLLCCAALAAATVHMYQEDFNTSHYRDAVLTTACWDTLSGELKMPPFEPAIIGSLDTPGTALWIAVAGDYAYVADYWQGFRVIDISDPTLPVEIGACDTPGQAHWVAVAGRYAYVADYWYGLQVIDVSDPTCPTIVGNVDVPDIATAVVLAGDYAYVAGGLNGLHIIDISDPLHPSMAATVNTPDVAVDVAVSGDYAYVTDRYSGLRVVDISDPLHPFEAGNVDTDDYAYGIAVAGDYAYIADGWSGLQVVDIHNPMSPSKAGKVAMPGGARGIMVTANYAYVTHSSPDGMQVVDISDPSNPAIITSLAAPGHSPCALVEAGNRAYVCNGHIGVVVWQIAEEVLPPRFASSFATPSYAHGIAAAGRYVFVAHSGLSAATGGLQIVDVTDPYSPTLLGGCDTPGITLDVAVSGDYAYLADEAAGLQVIDVKDPSNPVIVGNCDTPGVCRDVAISGDYAYVPDGYSGLQVIDIADPTNPTIAATCDTPDHAYGLAIDGDYAYVADRHTGLQVLDISDPTAPAIVGSCDTPGVAWGVVISGDYAYVTDEGEGLQVIDIRQPTSPVIVATYDTPDLALGLVVSGDRAYVTDYSSGLQVIDISDPTNPSLAASYDTPDWAHDVAVSGDYAYVADYRSGVQVIEVSQRLLNTAGNLAQSLPVDQSDDEIITGARLLSTQADSIRWELSADGGSNWQEFVPGADLGSFLFPGTDLLWRSAHFYAGLGINPTCTQLEVQWESHPPVIPATIDIDPDVLNPRSGGKWITAYIELPEGYDPNEIDISTALLNETVLAAAAPTAIADHDSDGVLDRVVKFSRSEVIAVLPRGEHVEVRVAGEVAEIPFAGADTIRVLMPEVICPNGGEIFEVGDECTVTWQVPAGYLPDWYNIYYTADDGAGWTVMAERVEGTSYVWLVPDDASSIYRVLVEAYDAIGVMGYDVSDQTFTVGSSSRVPQPDPIPTNFTFYVASANPSTHGGAVHLDLPEAARVRITVQDVRGHLVRILIDEDWPAGSQVIAWDGRNDSGARVPSGIYFVSVEEAKHRAVVKIVLVQ